MQTLALNLHRAGIDVEDGLSNDDSNDMCTSEGSSELEDADYDFYDVVQFEIDLDSGREETRND